MEEVEIKLLINVDHFKEIFYSNGQGNIFTAKLVKTSILATLMSIVISLVVYVISLYYSNFSWLIVLGALAVFISLLYTISGVSRYMKWKLVIMEYLKRVGKYKSCSIYINTNVFELKIDGDSYIEAWSKLQSCELKENYIRLLGATGEYYLFPAKAMTDEEFKILQEVIRERVK